jgi:hypothetical protein
LRYRIVSEVFSEFIERFEYLFISPNDDFRGAKEFQSYFITNLYCRLYVPNQIIVRRDERFAEMYLIDTGSVSVSLKDKF